MKISHHESKSGFFLSRSHIGGDSGFSSKIRIIPTKSGWLDSLIFQVCQLVKYKRKLIICDFVQEDYQTHNKIFYK